MRQPSLNLALGLALLVVWAVLVFGLGRGDGVLHFVLTAGVLLIIRSVVLAPAPKR